MSTARFVQGRQEADRLLDELVARHGPEVPQLAAAILERLRGTVPEFFADPDVAYDMAAAVDANVARATALLRRADPQGAAAPAQAGDLLQSTLQHAIPLISLLEAYRTAQTLATDWWQRRLDELAPEPALPAARHELHRRLARYIDTAAAEIREAYEAERRALEASGDGRQAHLIRRLLAGERLAVDAAARTLNYPLRARHVACAAWRATDDAPERLLQDALAALGDALGAGRLLTLAARHRVYAWFATHGALDLAAARRVPLPPEVAVAASGIHEGLEGFVLAHEEAVRTAGLVRDQPGGGGGRLTAHDEHELAVLLSRDPEARDRFVARVLGDLAGDDRHARRTRETLRAYLASGLSASRTAERLGLHRNTVAYRLGAVPDGVRQLLEPAADWQAQAPRRIELEVALELVHERER